MKTISIINKITARHQIFFSEEKMKKRKKKLQWMKKLRVKLADNERQLIVH